MATSIPKKSVGEEVVNHYGAVRLRVNGMANLQLMLLSLDEVNNYPMMPVIIQSLTNVEPNRVGNFTQQRCKLMITTTQFGENFEISKIVVFVRPVAMSYPE